MNRREFLKGLAIVGAAMPLLSLDSAPVFAEVPSNTLFPVWKILRAAWPDVVEDQQKLFGGWVSYPMQQYAAKGKAHKGGQLGARVEWSTMDAAGNITTHTAEVEALRTWLVWSKKGEQRHDTEATRIDFVARLIENALASADFLLEEHAKGREIVVSKDFYCDLGETQELENMAGWATPVWTCAAFIQR
jgi:hypothetical protein